MASFTFDDGTGSQTLSCSYPAPANRFRDIVPTPAYQGERAVSLARRRYQFITATAQRIRGTLPGVAFADEAKLRAFKLHAEGGGLFTMTTDDSESNVYTNCQLAADNDGNPIDLDIRRHPRGRWFEVGFEIEHVGSPQRVLRVVYFAQPSAVLNAESGSYTITGVAASLLASGMNAESGTYVISGFIAQTSTNQLDAESGSYAITGAAAATST